MQGIAAQKGAIAKSSAKPSGDPFKMGLWLDVVYEMKDKQV
jgi:hypothetical protein